MENSSRKTLVIALLVAFIDFFGVGLVYPLFSSMLFNANSPLLPQDSTPLTRGVWLALLIAAMPLAQFFTSPIWGAISDNLGRKKPLQWSLGVVLFGYIVAIFGVLQNALVALLISRIIIGAASGNTSIVQAAISDLSKSGKKSKDFGLYTMALGLGFTLGPFLGGLLSAYGYAIPFVFASLIILLNLLFAIMFFEETHPIRVKKRIDVWVALTQLKNIFLYPAMSVILIASFLYNFGWSYFFEFCPVYLIDRFQFSSVQLGYFYGAAGGLYALSAGLLIRPFVDRFSQKALFFGGIFLTALTIFTIPWIPSVVWLWPVIFFVCFFISFVTPTSMSLVSNAASPQFQGEALGLLNSVNTFSMALSPLFSGSFVGLHPSMPIWLGGSVMIVACCFGVMRTRSQRSTTR